MTTSLYIKTAINQISATASHIILTPNIRCIAIEWMAKCVWRYTLYRQKLKGLLWVYTPSIVACIALLTSWHHFSTLWKPKPIITREYPTTSSVRFYASRRPFIGGIYTHPQAFKVMAAYHHSKQRPAVLPQALDSTRWKRPVLLQDGIHIHPI